MRHIITFILLTAGLAAAGAPYTEPTYNQVERLIGAAGGTSVPSPVYTRPTYSQVERLIKTVKDGGGCDTNAVDILSNAAVVTNALTVATTNRVAVLEHSKADKSALDDKRDKGDLAVYEVVRTENTDWTLTTNVVDRLATTNGVAEAISANEKTGTNEQVVRGELWQDSMWLIEVENADLARRTVADEEGYNIMDTYATKSEVDDKADRATTLSGYGITDGATKTEVVPLWVAGHVYNAGDTVLYNGAYYRAMFDDTSSSPDKTFSYWEPITFENVYVYNGLSVLSGNLLVANGGLELVGGGITVDSGFEIKRGINKVVYGISVNGGAAQHGDVSIDIPAPGNYAAVSNAAMSAVQPWQISHTNAMFSTEVLAVGLNIDTNSVAVLNEIASTFGGFPLGAGGTATTVGGLLAALAAAIAWLKKNKVQTLKLADNSVETSADGGVAKLDGFFTESNSLLAWTIATKSIPAFSSSSTYEVGEIVIYDGVAYKCVTAITTAEEWTSSHWTLATNSDLAARLKGLKSDGTATDAFVTGILGKQVAKEAIDEEIIEKGTAPDAHLEAPTDEHLKLILADNSVAYDSAKALPYKLTSVIGDRVIATMTLNAASTDITLPAIAANDATVKDFILDVTNAYAVEGVATDAGINIPRTDFKLVTRDGESLTDVTTVKAGKSAFICFTQKSPVVVDGTTYPCWCVIQLPFGDPS